MTSIPTSGAILRAFAHTAMTAGTRHVGEVIAAYISYDGKFRGAPRGHSAFTMTELQRATGLSERTIQTALKDLARLFGLLILKRHHKRHFFRFSRIVADHPCPDVGDDSAAACQPAEAQTRSQVRASLYSKEQDNNCSSEIEIEGQPAVHKTPWASFIDRIKRGTPAEKMDTQYLWTGFCDLNRRNGHRSVPLRFLIGFLTKYPRKRNATSEEAHAISQSPQTAPIPTESRRLIEMAAPAPFENRHWHKSALIGLIGQQGYENRVSGIVARYNASRFAAEMAVHGEAVRSGEIAR